MLGLSQIWDEIRQADLKTGDNRQNLLLESIAGKNRASIASSILQNPDVLQSVYEDSSTKAAGSALEENQKYLDSISGQIGYILQKCNTQIIHLIAGISYSLIGQSAAKLRKENVQRLERNLVQFKLMGLETVDTLTGHAEGEDIV